MRLSLLLLLGLLCAVTAEAAPLRRMFGTATDSPSASPFNDTSCKVHLSFSHGFTFSPPFHPGVKEYSCVAGSNQTQITVKREGDSTNSGPISYALNGGGEVEISADWASGPLQLLPDHSNVIVLRIGDRCGAYIFTCEPTKTATNLTSCDRNDLVALNYALTLEHLEATFYRQYQAQFSASDFLAANLSQETYDRLTLIAAHEAAHVTALQTTIRNHGGEPVPPCEYAFGVTDVESYMSTARLLENTGVSAYDGAINSLSDPGLQQVAATIATVEARHAAFLNELTMESPFPSALDQPLSPEEVIQAIGPLIVSCPFQVTGPTVRPGGSQFNASMMSPAPSHSGPLKLQSRGHYTDEQLQNDLVALNYALTLEHLEATYYQQGLAAFDMVAFAAAGYSNNVFDNYVLIGAHEAAHVEALGALISARGGTPVPPCEYNFNLSTVEEFVGTAQLLENTGVSAYDGAVNTISDVGLQQIAAIVATVEARHVAYINQLLGSSPFPNSFDEAVAPEDIVRAVGPFIRSCSYEIVTPKAAPNASCHPRCELNRLLLGADLLSSPNVTMDHLNYSCSVRDGTFLASFTAVLPASSSATLSLVINNGTAIHLGSGVESAIYTLSVGSDSASLHVQSTAEGEPCERTYTFQCEPPSGGAQSPMFEWANSAFVCNASCVNQTVDLERANGTATRKVACVDESFTVVDEARCDALQRPPDSEACSVPCVEQQNDMGAPVGGSESNNDVMFNERSGSGVTAMASALFLVLPAVAALGEAFM